MWTLAHFYWNTQRLLQLRAVTQSRGRRLGALTKVQGKSPSDPWAVVYKPDGNFYVWMAFFNHTKTLICRRPGLMIEAPYLQTNKPVKIKTKFCFKVCFTGNNTKPNSSHYTQKTSKLSPQAPYLGNPIISATKTIRTKLFVRAVLLELSHMVSASGCFVGGGIPLFCTGKGFYVECRCSSKAGWIKLQKQPCQRAKQVASAASKLTVPG